MIENLARTSGTEEQTQLILRTWCIDPMEIKECTLGVIREYVTESFRVAVVCEVILQNHAAVQVQRDNFPEHVNGETIPPHAVLHSDELPRLLTSLFTY